MSCFPGVLLLAILSALCFPSSMLAQCTLPAAPSTGVPASTFDALVTQNGLGWTGGDGTYSTVLPDGRVFWGWSDSYIGTVDPITRLRQSYYPTAHNSLTIQNTSNNTLTTVGYPPNTGSYFVPQITSNEYWMATHHTVGNQNHARRILLLHLRHQGSGHGKQASVSCSHQQHQRPRKSVQVAVLERDPQSLGKPTSERYEPCRRTGHHGRIHSQQDAGELGRFLPHDRDGPAEPSISSLTIRNHLLLLQSRRTMDPANGGVQYSRDGRRGMQRGNTIYL